MWGQFLTCTKSNDTFFYLNPLHCHMTTKIKIYEINVRILHLLYGPSLLLVQEFDWLVTNPRCLLLHLETFWKLQHMAPLSQSTGCISGSWYWHQNCYTNEGILLILMLSPKILMILFWINHSISLKTLLQKIPEVILIILPHSAFCISP